MKVWCLFESSEHTDLYEQDNDGVCLVGIYATKELAGEAMLNQSKSVPVCDDDSHDESWCKIETSKWSRLSDDTLNHDCDWEWWFEEREVVE